TVGEELKNPGKNLPRAVIGSVVIVTAIYALVILVMMAVVKWDVIAGFGDTAGVDVARIVVGSIGAGVLTFAGLLATASSANASILASSRINFAMGRDKLISNWLNEIHDRFSTPHRSIGFTGALIVVFIVLGNVESLAKAGSVLHLIVYGLMNVALIVMREADVEYDPDYTLPLYPIIPVLGAVSSFGLIGFMFMDMALIEIALTLVFVAAAIVWYFAYARRKTDKRGALSQLLRRSENVPEGVASAAGANPDGGDYRVTVFVSNPQTEHDLISLASAIAKQRGGTVDAVHIVKIPDQTPLEAGAKRIDEIDVDSGELLESAREDAETFGVPVETHTIISHRSYEEMFDAARTHDADLAVMGWQEDAHGSPGRAESAIDELTSDLPCDLLMFKDRGFDPSHILVPTAGGPDSELSTVVAELLRAEYGSELTMLNVARNEDE
ncbi:MAG: amino acid permease, partial [Halobacteria archaeon]|nr:amino acid permease [Halobacteria archaeon]